MEFWRESDNRAKKPHKCELCNGNIKIGEIYHRETGKFDGEFFSRTLHIRCANFEADYCSYGEYEWNDWSDISYFIEDANCRSCPHFNNDDDECQNNYDIYNCPLLTEKYDVEIGEIYDKTDKKQRQGKELCGSVYRRKRSQGNVRPYSRRNVEQH